MVVIVGAVLIVVVIISAASPVLAGDYASCRDSDVSKCDVDEVQATMRRKKMPTELKVEVEGRLYSVPDDAEMAVRRLQVANNKWWKMIVHKARRSLYGKGDGSDSSDKAKSSDSDPATTLERYKDDPSCPGVDEEEAAVEKRVRSAGDHSCHICFGQDHSTVMLPCGHGGLCWDCGLKIYALTKECPYCRANIELLVPLDGGTRRYEGEDEFVSSAVFCNDGKPLVALRSDAALTHREG